jgi:hypothetical protein
MTEYSSNLTDKKSSILEPILDKNYPPYTLNSVVMRY